MSKDDTYNKNFTRIPNIIFVSPRYAHLTNEELFLYCKLRGIYWDTKPHFQSLRDISTKTKYSIGALSKMLPRVSSCGLIHAEIIQEYHPDGTKKGKPKYRLSITDIWEENREYFEKCSANEQYQGDNVQQMNDNVQQMNDNVHEKVRQRSANEHKRAPKNAPQAGLQLSKDNKDITKDSLKIESAPDVAQPIDPIASLPIDTTPTEPKATSSKKSVKVTRQRKTEPLKKTAPKLEDMTPGAQHVWEVWLKMPWNKGVPPKLTSTAIVHCEYLSNVEITEITMFNVRNFAKKNDRTGFYKDKSWELGDVVREYPRWQSAQYEAISENKEEKKMTVANLGLRPISSLPRL